MITFLDIVCAKVELAKLLLLGLSTRLQRVVRSVDGRLIANIYLGLILDGFDEYRNISAVDASIKMQYAIRPKLDCDPKGKLSFNPDTDRFLVIKVGIAGCPILGRQAGILRRRHRHGHARRLPRENRRDSRGCRRVRRLPRSACHEPNTHADPRRLPTRAIFLARILARMSVRDARVYTYTISYRVHVYKITR